MKALITGAGGQLGSALVASAPPGVSVIACTRGELDMNDAEAIRSTVLAEEPGVIVNAAAWTAVDAAETNEAQAHRINAEAVSVLADSARQVGARLIHVSTDFVFDGTSSTPYRPDSVPRPLGAYGRSKLAGERAISFDALIVRTAWVYAANGRNFVHTMLRLMAEKDRIDVVADQIGSPTNATSLAEAIWALDAAGARGIYHYTDAGVASWYDFAVAIQEEALALRMLQRSVQIVPIATSAYPTPAARPACAVLDKSDTWALLGQPAPHWRVNLRKMLKELQSHG